jgi:uncharacterized protein YecE (DUF72 family)
MWANKDWLGSLFAERTPQAKLLHAYSRIFNTVEGNTTFYSIPSTATVARWREQTPSGFRFCFKLPQEITHRRMLRHADDVLRLFLTRVAPLGDRLGPFLIQLPAAFGTDRIEVLERFLERLPVEFTFAVELRRRAFHTAGDDSERVNALLVRFGVDRVILDTRAMRAGDALHPDVAEAEHKKPNLPILPIVTAGRPIVRFVGHPDFAANEPFIDEWCGRLAGWLRQGHLPHVFAHCPDNRHAPALARRIHQALTDRIDVGRLPQWPGEVERPPEQLRLF